MALSKDEQRTLDEIERALREDDPKFVSAVSFERFRYHRLVIGGTVFMLGMIPLVAGEVAAQVQMAVGVVLSIAGFIAMFFSQDLGPWRSCDAHRIVSIMSVRPRTTRLLGRCDTAVAGGRDLGDPGLSSAGASSSTTASISFARDADTGTGYRPRGADVGSYADSSNGVEVKIHETARSEVAFR